MSRALPILIPVLGGLLLILAVAALAPVGAQLIAERLLPGTARTGYLGQAVAILPFWLGVFSSVANVVVAAVAWYAIQFASRQAREARQQAIEAEQTRAASLLSEIRRSWNSAEFVASRRLISGLTDLHERSRAKLPPLYQDRARFISRVLLDLRATNMGAYSEYTVVLDELEAIGILCRTQMIKLEHILEIFGGQVSYFDGRLGRFCRDLQDATAQEGYKHSSSVYANTLWLFAQAGSHRPFEFRGAAV